MLFVLNKIEQNVDNILNRFCLLFRDVMRATKFLRDMLKYDNNHVNTVR